MTDRKLEEQPACSVKSVPVPLEVTCPKCKAEVEMWSDETEAACSACSNVVKQ